MGSKRKPRSPDEGNWEWWGAGLWPLVCGGLQPFSVELGKDALSFGFEVPCAFFIPLIEEGKDWAE